MQYTSANGASNFKLDNMKDGGTYTLAVKGGSRRLDMEVEVRQCRRRK